MPRHSSLHKFDSGLTAHGTDLRRMLGGQLSTRITPASGLGVSIASKGMAYDEKYSTWIIASDTGEASMWSDGSLSANASTVPDLSGSGSSTQAIVAIPGLVIMTQSGGVSDTGNVYSVNGGLNWIANATLDRFTNRSLCASTDFIFGVGTSNVVKTSNGTVFSTVSTPVSAPFSVHYAGGPGTVLGCKLASIGSGFGSTIVGFTQDAFATVSSLDMGVNNNIHAVGGTDEFLFAVGANNTSPILYRAPRKSGTPVFSAVTLTFNTPIPTGTTIRGFSSLCSIGPILVGAIQLASGTFPMIVVNYNGLGDTWDLLNVTNSNPRLFSGGGRLAYSIAGAAGDFHFSPSIGL